MISSNTRNIVLTALITAIISVGISTLVSIQLLHYQKSLEEKQQEKNYSKSYSLMWSAKNTTSKISTSFFRLFELYTQNYFSKIITVRNNGQKSLHNVYFKILFKDKILGHSSMEDSPIPFQDYQGKTVTDGYAFKGKNSFDIYYKDFPPETTVDIGIILDRKITKQNEAEILNSKNPYEGTAYINVFSDEIKGVFIEKIDSNQPDKK